MATTAPSTAATAQPQVETKGQDLQHAVDLYQKGVELAHGAATYDDYCRAIELLSLAVAVRDSQPRFFLARGNAFRAISEFDAAARDYSAAIALDDRSPVYFANRGACYRKLGQPAAALEDLTIATEMDVRKGHHYFSRALVLFDAGYFREAVVDFTRALDEGSAIGVRVEYRALQNRGVCYRKLGNLGKCIDDLERAIRVDPRNPVGFSALAQAFVELGEWDRAIEHDTHAIELSKGGTTAYFSHRGLCYYRKGEDFARECLADLNSCVKLDGKDPQAYFYRGSVRLWLALELLEATGTSAAAGSAVTASTGTSTAVVAVSTPVSTRTNTVVPSVAKSSLDIAAEANGGLSSSALGFLTADEQLDAAFADIETAWSLSPGRAQYQLGMAMIAQLRGQHEDAGERFRAIGCDDRSNVVAHYHAALALHVLGGPPETALTLLSDAIDAVPDEPLFFEARALLLQGLQLHGLAVDDLSRALALQDNDDCARATNSYLRAESLLRLERFGDAVKDADAALQLGLAPDLRVSAYNARGMAYRGLGEYERALNDLSVCLADSPENDVFRFHRGLCFLASARYAGAIPDLLAAANANPRDSTLLYYIGLCYYYEHDTSESRKFLRLALDHEPSPEILSDVFYHIGLSCALESRNMDAIEHFTAALDHSRSLASPDTPPSAHAELLATQLQYVHERAKALQLERYYDEAIADFSFVLQHNPNNAHACFRRGFAYKAVGDLAAAAADLEAAKMLDPTNLQLVVNYRELRDTECVILCPPGQEKVY